MRPAYRTALHSEKTAYPWRRLRNRHNECFLSVRSRVRRLRVFRFGAAFCSVPHRRCCRVWDCIRFSQQDEFFSRYHHVAAYRICIRIAVIPLIRAQVVYKVLQCTQNGGFPISGIAAKEQSESGGFRCNPIGNVPKVLFVLFGGIKFPMPMSNFHPARFI